MNSPELNELWRLILDKKGSEFSGKVNIHIKSVAWKMKHAAHHKLTSHRAFNEIINKSKNKIIDSVNFILDHNAYNSYIETSMIAEANAIACAQCVYSVQDILSYILCYVFNLNQFDGNKTLIKIAKDIPVENVKLEIHKLTGSHMFCYLKDFVNHTKHVSLVESSYTADFKDISQIQQGMMFGAFSFFYRSPDGFKSREHKSKWYKEFLNDIDFIENSYLSIIRETNSYLKII